MKDAPLGAVENDFMFSSLKRKKMKKSRSFSKGIPLAMVLYSLCSSSMLFLNKLAASQLNLAPGSVVVVQIAVSTSVLLLLRMFGLIAVNWEWKKTRYFAIYICGFICSIYSSAAALKRSNVETFIVFRACTPLVVSLLDYLFLGRCAPSIKSFFALFGTAAAAAFYAVNDAQFIVEGAQGYSWCFAYVAAISFEMTFGKHLTSHLRLGIWESSLLTNLLGLPGLTLIAAVRGELYGLDTKLLSLDFYQRSILISSSCLAFAIGYCGWLCRSLVSATTYTLLGVVNKLATVLLAVLFLDRHATTSGLLALLACVFASSQYSQAPLRYDNNNSEDNDNRHTNKTAAAATNK